MPEGAEAAYIRKWCCKLSGYEDYETLWNQIGWGLRDELLRTPTDEEVRAAVNARLLEMENRVQKLLGMDIIDDVGDLIFQVPEMEKETELQNASEPTKEIPETEQDKAQQAGTADTERTDTQEKDTGKETDSSEQKKTEETKEAEETEP